MKQASLVPEKFRFLSGSWLKVLAVAAMLIDHIAAYLLADSDIVLFSLGSRSLRLYTLMRAIGRSAFPLFCFLLVEGFLHTHDRILSDTCPVSCRILLLYLLREAPLFRAVTGCCVLSGTWKVAPAFAAIALYNGKRGFIRGRVVPLLFYAFYPLHLLLLYWIRLRTVGF